MNISDVIFLGAGASVAEGAPDQGQMFRRFFEDGGLKTCPREMMDDLATFFKRFFGVDVRSPALEEVSFPTFEEALGVLDLALQRAETFKGFDFSGGPRSIDRLRKELVFLIALLLDHELRDEPYGSESRPHLNLVRRLQKEGRIGQTSFISTNYDIRIDNALLKLYPRWDVDYAIEFANFKRRDDDWARPRVGKEVYLCKVHGSLNWLYCPTCGSMTLTPKKKDAAELATRTRPCIDCQSPMIPVIVPPTFFKETSNFHMQSVWRTAEEALVRCSTIYFCGYSFPDADIHLKYLLKRAQLWRGSTPQIYVINRHSDWSTAKNADEKLRYRRFFGNRAKIELTDRSFQQFASDGL